MPKIKASIPHRTMVPAGKLGSLFVGGIPAGHVVHSIRDVSIGGPFLVCIEHDKEPLERSGCPNGGTRPFLVHLETGERHNTKHFHKDTMFFEVQCEMVVTG